MLKITRETDYAMLIMCQMARHQTQSKNVAINATALAQQTQISLAMASKLLKLLTKHGLLQSIRGANGGYQLVKPIEALTAADIICAIEGPLAINHCATHELKCERSLKCDLAPHWVKINQTIFNALSQVLLSELIVPAVSNVKSETYHVVLVKDVKRSGLMDSK